MEPPVVPVRITPPVRSSEPVADLPRSSVLPMLIVTVLVALVAGLGGAGYNETRPDVFQSTAVLIIDQEPASSRAGDEGIMAKLGRLRIRYVDLLSTTSFADPLAAELGLPAGQVNSALVGTAAPISLLLDVTATTGSADDAKRIAQGAAENLRDDLARQQTAVGIPAGEQITLTVVSPARDGVQTAPDGKRSLLIALVVMVAVLVVGGVLTDVLRRRRQG